MALTSKYAHPVLFVKKKDGAMRMCIDFHTLNANMHVIGTPYHILMICLTGCMVHAWSQRLIYVQVIIRSKSERVTSTMPRSRVVGDCINIL